MRKNVTIGSLPTGSRFYIWKDRYEILKMHHWAMYDTWSSVKLARDDHGTAVLFSKDIQVEIDVNSAKISTLKAGTKVILNSIEYTVVDFTADYKCLMRDFVVTYVDQGLEVEVV